MKKSELRCRVWLLDINSEQKTILCILIDHCDVMGVLPWSPVFFASKSGLSKRKYLKNIRDLVDKKIISVSEKNQSILLNL